MDCPRCRFTNPEGSRFCEECGSKLDGNCRECGASLRPEQRFCRECGHPVTAAAASPARTEADRPAHARIEQIVGAGERKNVTVLFADIADSTSLIESLDPEAAAQRLQPLLDAMQEAVHRYSGTVNKIQGDGIMALFGAPIALEEHAVMGCYAALAMQAAAATLSDAGLKLRIGLHSGEVVVRSVGNDLSIAYDAVGPTVHLAGRMEQMAGPGTTYLTEQTYRLAAGSISVRALGPTQVKGLRAALPVYELTGDRGVRSRWAIRASRGLSPLIGRQRDIDFLLRALDKAGAGAGQAVGVSGSAGIGKSRLLHELKRQVRNGWQVLEAGGAPYGQNISYQPISNFLRGWLNVTAKDRQDDIQRKLQARLGPIASERPEIQPAMESLLDLPVRDAAWQQLEPAQRRQWIINAIRLLILGRADQAPLLLIFEDLHWMDSETLAVLENVFHTIAGAPVLLVVTYRPGFKHGWGSKSYFSTIDVEPLVGEALDELLTHLIGSNPANEPLRRLLTNLSHGTPLFLEEMVRALAEDGTLVGFPGSYRLARDVADIRIPGSVEAIIAARIDNLSVEHKNLLQTAAVIGKTFPLTLLEEVSDLPRDRLLEGIERLQAGEFIYAARLLSDAEYSFKHALTQDVAYRGALQERRRNLHLRALTAIEKIHGNRLDEFVESLAYHATRAEQWEKAFALLERAGNKAIERSAYSEAATHFEAALAAGKNRPPSETVTRRTIGLRLGLRAAFGPMGELGRMYDHLDEAEKDARSIGDQRLLAAVNSAKIFVFTLNGDLDDAISAGEAALDIASELGDIDLTATASALLGQGQHFRGDFKRSIETLERVEEFLTGEARHRRIGTTSTTSVFALYTLASARASMGNFGPALEAAGEAVRIAEEVDRPYDHSLSLGAVGAAHFWRGEYEAALEAFEQGIEVCRSGDIRSMFPWLSAQAGGVLAQIGDHARAAALLESARERASAMNLVYYRAWAIAFSGTAALESGDHALAQRCLEQAVQLSDQHGYWAVKCWCLRHLGELEHCRAGDPRDSERLVEQARSVAESGGMRPEVAHCERLLARLHSAAGRHGEAREAHERATGLYASLGMNRWVDLLAREVPGAA